MKSLSRIKLNQLSKAELDEREMKTLVGGCAAHCCCRKGNVDNAEANIKGGLHASLGYEGYSSFTYEGCPTTSYDIVIYPEPKN